MNFLAWILTLSLIFGVAVEAVAFHKATVCRQEAWRLSAELVTRSTLDQPPSLKPFFEPRCQLLVKKRGEKVHWSRLPYLVRHNFIFELTSKL